MQRHPGTGYVLKGLTLVVVFSMIWTGNLALAFLKQPGVGTDAVGLAAAPLPRPWEDAFQSPSRPDARIDSTLPVTDASGSRLADAPLAVQGSTTYTIAENFSDYASKDYVEGAEWDIWDNELRLAFVDGALQEEVTIAPDGQGGAFVVWADRRHGIVGDIYAQRVDADGNRLWQYDLRVSSDAIGTKMDQHPAMVVDSNHNVVIVWMAYSDIYAQKIDLNGNKLWASDKPVGTGGSVLFASLGLAIDGNNNAVIAWDRDDAIYAQQMDTDGTLLWATEVQVNTDTTGERENAAVGVDGNGNAVVAWHDLRNGVRDIYAQKLNSAGTRQWTGDVLVNSSPGMVNQFDGIDIVVDASGNSVVAWTDGRNDATTWDDIYAQRLDAAGSKQWAGDVRVSSDTVSNRRFDETPALRIDDGGNVVVVWASSSDIRIQQLDANGNKLWTEDVRVSSSNSGDPEEPAMVILHDGQIIVVWSDGRNARRDIYGQRLGTTGNRLWAEGDVRVSHDNGAVDQRVGLSFIGRNVGVDSTGQAMIVWSDSRNNKEDIYIRPLDTNGTRLWEADIQVSDNNYAYNYYDPSIAVDGNGTAIVVWDGSDILAACRRGRLVLKKPGF